MMTQLPCIGRVRIKRRVEFAILGVIFLGMAHVGWGQEVSVTASVDHRKVSLNEQLTLTVAVTGANVSGISEPRLPSLEGFKVLGSARSTSISWINGQMTATQEYRYTLMPKEIGTFTIDPVEVRVGKQTFRTDKIVVQVVQAPQGGAVPRQRPQQEESANVSPRGDIFITADVDKRTAYVSEQITLTFSYYSRLSLWDQPRYTPPETPGFWVEELPRSPTRRKVIRGRLYEVQEIKTALFPTSAGKQVISRAYLEYQTRGFGFFSQPRVRRLATDPIEIEVLPLPAQGKPKGFSGAVGQYALSATVDKRSVHKGDPVTLLVKIAGTGNINTVGDPVAPSLDGFKIYEPEVKKSSSVVGEVIQGEKTFRYALVPEVEGDLEIGSFEFSYFDPSKKSYQTISTAPLRVTVMKGEPQPSELVTYGLSREEIKLVGKDIRFIKPPVSQLKHQGGMLYRYPLFWFLQVIPILTFGVLVLYRNHRTRLESNIAYARRRRAKGEAIKRLRRAQALLKSPESRAFCGEVHKALAEFLGDKLNLPAAGITTDQVSDELIRRGVEEDVVEDMKELFGQCDLARFAPMDLSEEERTDLLHRGKNLIERLEKEL